jgi:hypothetical protein
MKLLGVVSAVALNLVIWGLIALVFTVGLAAADASATTFYVVWVFFAAVMVGGSFLMIKWGQGGGAGYGEFRLAGRSCSWFAWPRSSSRSSL